MFGVNQVLIAGPVGAGKTQYLGTLKLTAERPPSEEGAVRCQLVRTNEPMEALDRLVRRRMVRESQPNGVEAASETILPATADVQSYEFGFECDTGEAPKGLFGGSGSTTYFRLFDGPGGVEVGRYGGSDDRDENRRNLRQAILEHARKSQGLLLCVDSSDENKANDFFKYLSDLFNGIGKTPLPFRRVVVLLTKADKYFARLALGAPYRDESRAASLAREADPWERARFLLTDYGIGALQQRTSRDAQIVCGWCSVFGFVPGEGVANYDPWNECFRYEGTGLNRAELLERWRPFRLLDPLIFFATGRPGALKPLNRDRLG